MIVKARKATAPRSQRRAGATETESAPDLRSQRSERTQQQILAAAEAEFADKGLAGARVDTIAEESGVNKQMIYYYYGSKEYLYLAVLERAYAAMRQSERELNLENLNPMEAIRKLVEFKFSYYAMNPTIIRLLAGENMQNAKFLKQSSRLRDMHISLIDVLQTVLAAGEKNKTVRPGIDPVQLYFSIAALSYFYFANAATLSAAFGRPLASSDELKKRTDHAIDVILTYVRAA